MKKYLMTTIAVVAMGAAFTSCSHHFDIYNSGDEEVEKEKYNAELIRAEYEAVFETVFGKPDPNHTWGFSSGNASTRALTRAISVNGDTYEDFTAVTSEEITSAFPSTISGDADEVPTNGDYNYYYNNGAGHNYKITAAGEYTIGGSWMNTGWITDSSHPYGGYTGVYYYNVYIKVNGDVTLKRNGDAHFNLYILQGNVTLDSNFGEMSGTISVANGATLNDNRDHIACNYGVKLFNRGTVNVGAYKIGNNAKVYNEGTFTATGALEYNSGAGNTSYFYNMGDDVVLTAPSMTLNSTCNFISDGTVNISGETFVTKDGIVWVNNGHYTTGKMTFSAKNTTFYNYCNLTVTGLLHMYDGEFNLMDNSYTEAGTAEFDNFIVNMGSNAGMNIKGTVKFEAQGDGTYQGFHTNGSNDYLLIGGKVTVASHKKTFSVSSGITYSIKEIEIVRGGQVITEAQLQAENSGDYPVLDLNGTECPFGKLTVTPNTNSCGATWEFSDYDGRVMAEDLNAQQSSDFDFNDVVFDWKITGSNTVEILIKAAGGIYPLYVGDATHEVHAELGYSTTDDDGKYQMINTGAGPDGTAKPFIYTFTNKENITIEDIANIPVWVVTEEGSVYLENYAEGAACKFNTSPTTRWMKEYKGITKGYPDFSNWVQNEERYRNWASNKKEEFLY